MSDIVLSAGVRQNLLSLQKTADLMSTTQNRLATGKKVNTALDNPTNFFTSSALQSRAGDFNALLDSMSIGIKTLEAADNGITAITNTIEFDAVHAAPGAAGQVVPDQVLYDRRDRDRHRFRQEPLVLWRRSRLDRCQRRAEHRERSRDAR